MPGPNGPVGAGSSAVHRCWRSPRAQHSPGRNEAALACRVHPAQPRTRAPGAVVPPSPRRRGPPSLQTPAGPAAPSLPGTHRPQTRSARPYAHHLPGQRGCGTRTRRRCSSAHCEIRATTLDAAPSPSAGGEPPAAGRPAAMFRASRESASRSSSERQGALCSSADAGDRRSPAAEASAQADD